jgi:hypothetical protein
MAWWDITLMVLCLALGVAGTVFTVFAISSAKSSVAAYKADEKKWKVLKTAGVHGEARIERMSRQAQRLTKAGSYGNNQVAATDLLLSYADAAGVQREVPVSTFIETSLLANFVEGRTVSIVYAREDPQSIAIDRDRTPLEIPPSDMRGMR